MAGSLERRHDLLVFLDSRIPPVLKIGLRQETKFWVDVAGWIKLHHSRREISPRSSILASTPLHEDAPGTLISLLLFMLLVHVGDVKYQTARAQKSHMEENGRWQLTTLYIWRSVHQIMHHGPTSMNIRLI